MEGDEVIISRYMQNAMAPPLWYMVLRGNGLADGVAVDRWWICHFTPSSRMLIEVGMVHVGRDDHQALVERKMASIVVDLTIPESATSTWYPWGVVCNLQAHD